MDHTRVMRLCAGLLLTVVISGATARPMQEVDLLIGGEFVVTIDDTRPVIRDGAVAVKDGRIVAVGAAAEIFAAYHAPLTLPGEQRVLMPGLVNGHTHAAMVLFRGIADDLALIEWLNDFIFPAEGMFVNAKFIRTGTQLACWEMIRGATTTFVDMYFHPDVIAEVVDACGLRAIIASAAIDFPSPGFSGWDDAFAAASPRADVFLSGIALVALALFGWIERRWNHIASRGSRREKILDNSLAQQYCPP